MNWGNKLFLAFTVFVGGMIYLVYRSVKTDFELVEKDYYKNELRYQEVIDGTRSANALSTPLQVSQEGEGEIRLRLPAEMKQKNISGQVWFYCSYDAARDRQYALATNAEGVQVFPAEKVNPGNYIVRVRWHDGFKEYYTEKNLTVF